MKKKFRYPKHFSPLLWVVAVVVVALFYFLPSWDGTPSGIFHFLQETLHGGSSLAEKEPLPHDTSLEDKVRVHVIDVGQGLCVLVQGSEKTVLIDGGEAPTAASTIAYLQEQGVEKLDRVVNTHPHYDHFGGLREIMENFPTQEFILPDLPENKIPTTISYQKLVDYLETSKIPVIPARVGETYPLGGEAIMTTLAPVGNTYENLNDWSVVNKVTFGDISFLITGDIENEGETDLVEDGASLKCNVLVLPHHGSQTSIFRPFVEAAYPQYGVISCGKNNKYGHPHHKTLALYQELGIPLLRTDEVGTVVFETDGQTLDYHTSLSNAA